MTSDTSDVRGPIPLTPASVQVNPLVCFTFVSCNLSAVNAWHMPCLRSEFNLCSEGSRTMPAQDTHGRFEAQVQLAMVSRTCAGATVRVSTF